MLGQLHTGGEKGAKQGENHSDDAATDRAIALTTHILHKREKLKNPPDSKTGERRHITTVSKRVQAFDVQFNHSIEAEGSPHKGGRAEGERLRRGLLGHNSPHGFSLPH